MGASFYYIVTSSSTYWYVPTNVSFLWNYISKRFHLSKYCYLSILHISEGNLWWNKKKQRKWQCICSTPICSMSIVPHFKSLGYELLWIKFMLHQLPLKFENRSRKIFNIEDQNYMNEVLCSLSCAILHQVVKRVLDKWQHRLKYETDTQSFFFNLHFKILE